jgi:sec-independent protein translocase protein TatC
MSFLDHLSELRSRLIRVSVAVTIGFFLCVYVSDRLFKFLAAPIVKRLPSGSSLVFTGLPDPVFIYLKIAFVCGLFLALPYCLYEIWRFIRPGLYDRERRLAAPFIFVATLLFYLGGAFAYFIVFPTAFDFFLSFETPELKPMIAIREYVWLIMVLMLAFGLVFETPVVIVFLGLLGIFDSDQLRRGRRYFVVIAFIIAAVLTPTPDPLNQAIMAVPMILLYEVGVRILVLFEKRRLRDQDEDSLETG